MVFESIGIAGIGLLGGSIALRARQVFNRDIKLIGFSRNPNKLRSLPQSEVFDEIFSYDEARNVNKCDLVILCTPVLSIPKIFQLMRPFLKETVIVTDIGSTKYEVVKEISDSVFVGSHPMAGSEKTGFENSDSSIFDGAVCVVTPYNNTDEQVDKVSRFWEELGMKVIELPPDLHDEVVAKTSHSIHIISFLISFTLSKSRFSKEKFFKVYGKGLLDTTRISKSDPEMWYDIIVTNRRNIGAFLKEFRGFLEHVESLLEKGDNLEQLRIMMEEARDFREKL